MSNVMKNTQYICSRIPLNFGLTQKTKFKLKVQGQIKNIQILIPKLTLTLEQMILSGSHPCRRAKNSKRECFFLALVKELSDLYDHISSGKIQKQKPPTKKHLLLCQLPKGKRPETVLQKLFQRHSSSASLQKPVTGILSYKALSFNTILCGQFFKFRANNDSNTLYNCLQVYISNLFPTLSPHNLLRQDGEVLPHFYK